MARRRSTPRVSTGSGSDIVVVNTPAPVTRRASSGRRSRRRSSKRRRSSSSGGGGSYKGKITALALGGAAYGFLEKTFGDRIPTVPFLGKSGTVALAGYFFQPKNAIIRDACLAAAVIAGYSLGKEGRVAGDYDEDEHGLAAEA